MKKAVKRPGNGLRRKDPGAQERLSIHVTPAVAERLRVYCARARVSLSLAIEQALEKFLPADRK